MGEGHPIEFVEWIAPADGERLAAVGVRSIGDLLARGATVAAREALAGQTGIEAARLLRWVWLADLMRLPGMRDTHAALLDAAGIRTVSDLAERDPPAFARELRRLNVELTLARSVPSESQLAQWRHLAGSLAPAVET
jgi:hypothetical protein